MNTDQGIRAAARGDLERAEVLWGRAISATERFLAELPAGAPLEEDEEVLADSEASARINEFLAILSRNQGRAIASERLLPAPRAQLRRELEVAYTNEPVDELAEALIALPLFISDEDAVVVERYLERRAGRTGPIGRANWDRAVAVVGRVAGEQRFAMRHWLGISPDVAGVESTIPILQGLATARDAAARLSSRRSSGIEALVGWAIVGIVTLVVLGGVALVAGEPVVPLLVLQLVTLVVGVIPALSIFEAFVRALARRDAGAADVAAGLLPLALPVLLAIAIWLLVTSV
jgi:hypothetical protein